MSSFDRDVLTECADDVILSRDSQLVAVVGSGVPGAFATLHALYSPRLYKMIIGITKSPEDAEDPLQETFLRLHSNLHTFEGRSGIYSGLTRIAMNLARIVLRRVRSP